ncbi:phenylalanine--tRNA ligase subunit beta [Spiroplasma melliferum]|uniref:Phenylalanine--tRNA ligase beta subunit n=2 Tax=Spiroplasma melliferum TaxID=2134 RepID=A0AAI9T3A0_SPIME|nr:phenylalanine--tRNA ligase subunit beta [Spiroplasma melliferum]KAI92540.1 phenylalanyl-tRNA synthetase subunit beta [Spiroplasma melliferum KC3]QCO24126.1 phenylalanyl-tRNA synthetase subunit beta [Spiroplasma melliferum]
MIITRRWLNKYIDFTDISNADIAAALNSLGFEVERTHNFDCNSNIVCGRIQVVNEIPDTHLKFCLVDTGQELVDPIVCGASNPAENGYVVVARPGAVLANGTKIAKREIKGYASEGMMCSLSELGIGEKYLTAAEQDEIILTFNEKEVSYDMIGAEDILTKIGLTDYLFEIDLTLNRSDCLSAYELARELARYFKRELFPLELESTENLKEYQNPLKVVIATSAVESAISVNVKLTPEKSPLKLSDRIWLKINEYQSNVADPFGDLAIKATLETGQPLLLYDFNKIKNPLKITDDYENKTFNIKKGDLVVVDGNEFVELIGIRVNPAYAISATTTEITVLALHLNHIVMRQQQRKVGTSNINLQRYIKPLSYATVGLGLSRYLYLLKINGFLAELSVLNFIKEYKKTVEPISLTLLEINQFIGHSFTLLEIKALLEPLAFQFKEEGEQLFVTPPVTRTDIFQKVDLIEEIVRLFGYNNIIAKPPVLPNLVKAKRPAEKTIKNFETFFLNNGFYQAKTYALVKQEEITNFNFFNYQKPYQLLSPLSEEHAVMRLSLTNSLLNSVGYNNARNQKNVKLFTVEKIYANEKSYYHGAFVSQIEIVQNKITGDNLSNSYYYIKSLLEAYVQSEQIDINELSYQQAPKNKVYHPYQTSHVFLGKQLLAIIGLIHPAYQKEVNLKSATYFGEINFEVIFNYPQKKQTFFTPLSKFSASNRDISIWVPATVTYEQIKKKILTGVKNVVAIEVIDQYFDHNEMPNYVALTISFTFNDMTKQLTEADINQQFEQIKMNLKKLQLQIR